MKFDPKIWWGLRRLKDEYDLKLKGKPVCFDLDVETDKLPRAIRVKVLEKLEDEGLIKIIDFGYRTETERLLALTESLRAHEKTTS